MPKSDKPHHADTTGSKLDKHKEEERKRISLDIHDRLGQSLTGLKLGLSSLVSRLGKDADVRARAKDLFRALDETIQTVREISTELRPAILDSLGLRAAIEWQARKFEKSTGLACRLDLPPRDVALDPTPEIAHDPAVTPLTAHRSPRLPPERRGGDGRRRHAVPPRAPAGEPVRPRPGLRPDREAARRIRATTANLGPSAVDRG